MLTNTTKQRRELRKNLLLAASEQQRHHCAYCGIETWSPWHFEIYNPNHGLDPKNKATLEHLIPQSKGGEDVIENCVMACEWCNNRRDIENVQLFYDRLLRAKAFVGDINQLRIKYDQLVSLEKNLAKAMVLLSWLFRMFPEIMEFADKATKRCLDFYNVPEEVLL